MRKLVAIHQPNFFPWLGYFDKIRRADVFVLLDDVQFPKTGGIWTNRVKILHGNEGKWLTAPIERTYAGLRNINAMQYASTDWRTDALRRLEGAYRKAPHYREAMALLEPLLTHSEQNIAAYNTHALHALCAAFGLRTPLVASSAHPVTTAATDRLIALTKAVGGTHYLAGGGAEGYQQDDAFAAHHITLEYQHFMPQPYAQFGTSGFVAGLSVIDALMQLGVQGTRHLVCGEAHA